MAIPWICLFCMGPIHQRKHNSTWTGTAQGC
jgi:hypothetical protein